MNSGTQALERCRVIVQRTGIEEPAPRDRTSIGSGDHRRTAAPFKVFNTGVDEAAGLSHTEALRARLRTLIGPTLQRRAGWDDALMGDRVAMSLCLARDRIALPLARAAQFFVRDKGWFAFGYARVEDHARERFGRSGRWVRDLAGLAEGAARLPGLVAAMTGEDGGVPIGRVAALLIGKTASAESPWLKIVSFLEKVTTLRPSPIVARNFFGSKSRFFLAGRASAMEEGSPGAEVHASASCQNGIGKDVHFCSQLPESGGDSQK